MVPLPRGHTQLGCCTQTRIGPAMSLCCLGQWQAFVYPLRGAQLMHVTVQQSWGASHCVQSSLGKSSFLTQQEPDGSGGLWTLVGLIAESPVDAQVQNTSLALPGKFAPLQQGLNALSTWFCSHSPKIDHTNCTRIHREIKILPPPPKSMLDGYKDRASTPVALQQAIKGSLNSPGLNFVSE